VRILGTEREFFSGDLRCRLYPLVNVNKKLWKIIIFIGKSTRNGQFSIANCLFTRGKEQGNQGQLPIRARWNGLASARLWCEPYYNMKPLEGWSTFPRQGWGLGSLMFLDVYKSLLNIMYNIYIYMHICMYVWVDYYDCLVVYNMTFIVCINAIVIKLYSIFFRAT
jgi:hypothetical protein